MPDCLSPVDDPLKDISTREIRNIIRRSRGGGSDRVLNIIDFVDSRPGFCLANRFDPSDDRRTTHMSKNRQNDYPCM